jgi:hypothetical protein
MVEKVRIERRAMGNRACAQWQVGTDRYDDGVLLLPEGTVGAMMQGDDESFHLTRLDFVLDGRHYIVSVNRRYTKRGVIRFAREVLRRELGIRH